MRQGHADRADTAWATGEHAGDLDKVVDDVTTRLPDCL